MLVYKTDPLNRSSKPAAWSNVTESFENFDLLPPGWTLGGFYADASEASHGKQSLRSPPIGNAQTAILRLDQEFVKGSLSFDFKTDSESCCDALEFWVDGRMQFVRHNQGWIRIYQSLSQGRHVIEWRYKKDGSVSSGKDALFIDNLHFNAE